MPKEDVAFDTATCSSPSSAKPESSPVASGTTQKRHMGALTGITSVVNSVYSTERRPPWRATIVRFGPLSGLFCMLLSIASLIASLGVLAGSDGQPVDDWSAPPATYIAIFTAISNLSVRYAAIQGVVISWWTRASKGSTLGQLYWDWRSGTSFIGALVAGRHMSLVGLACIFSTIVVLDGPLLQRCSTVISGPMSSRLVPLNVDMTPELPSGLGGYWEPVSDLGEPGLRFSSAFNDSIPTNINGSNPQKIWAHPNPYLIPVYGYWWGNAILSDVVRGCPASSICTAKIRAPTLSPTKCTTQTIRSDFQTQFNCSGVLQGQYAPPFDSYAFLIDASLIVEKLEMINLITGYAAPTQEGCQGSLNYTICTMVSAIGEYNVTIRGDSINLDNLGEPSLIAFANNTAVNRTLDPANSAYPSTLGGYAIEAQAKWSTFVSYFTQNGASGQEGLTAFNPVFQQFMVPDNLSSGTKCPSFRDPQKAVLQSLNRLMVYAGAFMARTPDFAMRTVGASLESRMDPGISTSYNITGHIVSNQNVFSTDYWYFGAAAIVELVCIALVLPTYWGWWKIGRPVSLSPLELAKAFESPLLEDQNSNSSARQLARATQNVRVRYGMQQRSCEHSEISEFNIAFGNPNTIKKPQQGLRFSR